MQNTVFTKQSAKVLERGNIAKNKSNKATNMSTERTMKFENKPAGQLISWEKKMKAHTKFTT